jgi:hypothetical protein
MVCSINFLIYAQPLPSLQGEGQGWGLDSAMPLARQECSVIEEDTDPTPRSAEGRLQGKNPSPTREGRGDAFLTNK